MRPHKVIIFEDGELHVKLTVQRADIQAGMKRTRLQIEADEAQDSDPDVRLLRRFTYPDLMAATSEADGIPWPLAFDDYLALPERLGILWEKAVYELNPHWLPAPPGPPTSGGEVSEKKESATPSTDG